MFPNGKTKGVTMGWFKRKDKGPKPCPGEHSWGWMPLHDSGIEMAVCHKCGAWGDDGEGGVMLKRSDEWS